MNQKIQLLLSQISKTSHLYWNISPETGQFLNLLIRERNYKNILEIGTSNGYSGIWIAEALSHTKGHLYTIESHKKERFYLATENFAKSGLSKYITQILGHAPEIIPSSPRKFDFVFLDATKYEYISYFDAIASRLKKGGIIIADNLYSHRKELSPYLKHVKKDKKFFSIELPLGSGLLLSLKI